MEKDARLRKQLGICTESQVVKPQVVDVAEAGGVSRVSIETLGIETFEFPNSLCIDRFWNGLKAKREISEHFCPRCTRCCGLGRPSGNQWAWRTW